jgi:hypothetical protein
VSKGFSDAAFASFSRRRSTVREDLAQSFSAGPPEEKPAASSSAGGSAFLDLINSDSPASLSDSTPKAIAAPKRGRGAKAPKAGAAGAGAAGRGGRGRPRAGGDSGLKEV